MILSEGQRDPEGHADAEGPVSVDLTHWVAEEKGQEVRHHQELKEGLGS